MLKGKIPRKDMFSDEMVGHVDVLCLSMENRVSSKMDTIVEIVVVDKDSVVDGDVHIFHNPLEPNNFTCSHDYTLVF